MSKKWVHHTWSTLLLASLLVSGCTTGETKSSTSADSALVSEASPNTGDTSAVAAEDAGTAGELPAVAEVVSYEADDAYSDWTMDGATEVALSGNGATIDGDGATADGSTVTISSAGTYVLSGTLTDGQIVVDSAGDGTVRLVLNGVSLSSSTSAPIYIKAADKAVISLQEGTENRVVDAETYVYADAATDEPDAAIFSKDDLTINGSGSLYVHGRYNNGITSKDDLKIVGGILEIDAVDDGIKGKDLVAVQAGDLTIRAAADAIKTTNDTDEDKGYIAISGGSFTLVSGNDGMQAERAALIEGGTFDIVAGGGKTEVSDAADAPSTKGIKGVLGIRIAAGELVIDAADDALHSNGAIEIAGGTMKLATGDDGIHADESIDISDGIITITDSYEGIESNKIAISGGEIDLVSSDDGINAASGSASETGGGRPGAGSTLSVSGGYVVVDAGGDGLDANGSIEMSGGTVLVNGPTNNGNGALDYDGTFTMSGGVVIAAGSSGMAQATSDASTQPSILMTYPQSQPAGTLVQLEDSDGRTIVTFAPTKAYQSVVISTPELQQGGSYTLYSGGSDTGVAVGGLYSGGTYSGGTEVVSFEIASSVTWLDQNGVTEARSGMFGGMGGGQGGGPGMRGQGRGGEGRMPPEGMEEMTPPEGMEGMTRPEGMEGMEGMSSPDGTFPEGGDRPSMRDERAGAEAQSSESAS
ncbi:carbohydrate-binding domain-containing protein [Paenibacillus sp. 598K]|uniref:carbohydrate-binding domain-containing protein n=1 Tax=Paenibacillus sp. 598K TaxID=1117987 RepID=UPI000FFEF70F|nr:carbohydrate-binding domain-containing protein [Paenibacillus sp. 598K]